MYLAAPVWPEIKIIVPPVVCDEMAGSCVPPGCGKKVILRIDLCTLCPATGAAQSFDSARSFLSEKGSSKNVVLDFGTASIHGCA